MLKIPQQAEACLQMPALKLPSSQILKLINSRNYTHSENLLLKWLPTQLGQGRGQVIAPMGVARRAVDRTRQKRILRNLLKLTQSGPSNNDFLLIAKRGMGGRSLYELMVQAQKLFRHLH